MADLTITVQDEIGALGTFADACEDLAKELHGLDRTQMLQRAEGYRRQALAKAIVLEAQEVASECHQQLFHESCACGDDPGIYVDGKPYCVVCISQQYPHSNVLGEGPNVSRRGSSGWSGILVWAAIAAGSLLALWGWRITQ